VDKGANIDIIGEQNRTALHLAAQEGFKEIVDILIKAKSKVNTEVDGATVLMVACYNNHLEVVKLLLAAGVNSHAEYEETEAIQLTTSEAIIKEIKAFEKDRSTYILKHNEQAQYALNAFNNLKMGFPKAKDAFVEVEECLEAQAQYESLNLNDICGTAGSYYYHDDL